MSKKKKKKSWLKKCQSLKYYTSSLFIYWQVIKVINTGGYIIMCLKKKENSCPAKNLVFAENFAILFSLRSQRRKIRSNGSDCNCCMYLVPWAMPWWLTLLKHSFWTAFHVSHRFHHFLLSFQALGDFQNQILTDFHTLCYNKFSVTMFC